MIIAFKSHGGLYTGMKHKYRSMVPDRKHRDKPMQLWSLNLRKRRQEYTMKKRQPLQ